MNDRKGRRALALWLVLCQLTVAGISPAGAQSSDRTPPLIEFQPLEEGRRGDTQVFSASVSDDTGVESVTLRYRVAAGEPYRELAMEPLGTTDIYTASVSGADAEVASIQYYIEAIDVADNRSIEGFAFDPLERVLVEPGVPIAGAAPPSGELSTGMTTGQKILYGVLGVVVVGAIAAAASGGGGGSDGAPPLGDDTDVPVTVVVDPLP